MSVIKSGVLGYPKAKPKGRKDTINWVTYNGELWSNQVLELKAAENSKGSNQTINLIRCTNATTVEQSTTKVMLTLADGSTHTVLANNEVDRDDWIRVICEVCNILNPLKRIKGKPQHGRNPVEVLPMNTMAPVKKSLPPLPLPPPLPPPRQYTEERLHNENDASYEEMDVDECEDYQEPVLIGTADDDESGGVYHYAEERRRTYPMPFRDGNDSGGGSITGSGSGGYGPQQYDDTSSTQQQLAGRNNRGWSSQPPDDEDDEEYIEAAPVTIRPKPTTHKSTNTLSNRKLETHGQLLKPSPCSKQPMTPPMLRKAIGKHTPTTTVHVEPAADKLPVNGSYVQQGESELSKMLKKRQQKLSDADTGTEDVEQDSEGIYENIPSRQGNGQKSKDVFPPKVISKKNEKKKFDLKPSLPTKDLPKKQERDFERKFKFPSQVEQRISPPAASIPTKAPPKKFEKDFERKFPLPSQVVQKTPPLVIPKTSSLKRVVKSTTVPIVAPKTPTKSPLRNSPRSPMHGATPSPPPPPDRTSSSRLDISGPRRSASLKTRPSPPAVVPRGNVLLSDSCDFPTAGEWRQQKEVPPPLSKADTDFDLHRRHHHQQDAPRLPINRPPRPPPKHH